MMSFVARTSQPIDLADSNAATDCSDSLQLQKSVAFHSLSLNGKMAYFAIESSHCAIVAMSESLEYFDDYY